MNIDKMVGQFREFLLFCKDHLELDKLPKIHWYTNDDVGESRPSFGSFHNEDQVIKIGINNRHPLDIMRTLAHELTHYKQWTQNKLHSGSGETGSPEENEANAVAGIIMRDWNAAHEEMFKQTAIDEAITLGKKKDGRAAKWIDHMYATLPRNPMNPDQIALVYGEGDDQGLALIELEPDHYYADTANIKWIQAYPQRQGVGRKALTDIQHMAAEAGVSLSLVTWKLGKVSPKALAKFYKSMGFGKDTKSGQLKWTAPVSESDADSVPQEVWDFIKDLTSEDVGKERIDDYVVHFEGFSDMCQIAAAERCKLPSTDPLHLNKYDDVYDEVLADFIGREAGDKPVASGLAGDEWYPIFYAVFYKPILDESTLTHIDQHHDHGGSLEGYVVDTDQPQLYNYLTGQGASPELAKKIASKYHRVGIIRNMWVDEDLRNGGIGSEMLESAIDQAFGQGADAIILVADMAEDNSQLGKPLDKWYAGWGFETVGRAGSDIVMVLDNELHEVWSKKYKKSINCSHPKGFSQKAHCAGRRARQAGKHTKSKSVSESAINKLYDRKHLDTCLVKLCSMIVEGQQTDPDYHGMVAAAVLDPDHNKTASTSTRKDGKWRHAERNAIDLYLETYGEIPEGSIIVTTLSPCDNAMSNRYGHSCTDLINECPVNEVYCGYMDPSQLDEDFEFTVEDTKNTKIQELCKKFAATFLVNENFADGKGPGRPGDSQRHGIPKGATIAQLEKAAKAPGRKGQLARWQLNMRRGRAKNESIVSEGTTAFHSSAVSTISKFNSFSHFGTEAAAADRIKNLIKQKRLSPDALITIYSVDLNIKNPLMIRDYANVQHSAGIYAAALKDKKIIDQDIMVRIRSNNPFSDVDSDQSTEEKSKLWPKYEKNNLATIKKILKSKGYDGLVYKNAAEDKGSLSYVILDPNQVRITGKKQIPAKELIKTNKLKVAEDSKLLDKPTPTVGELAEKYHTSLLAVEQQMRKGIRVEMEHTGKYRVAKEIALDHLEEEIGGAHV